MRHPLRRPYIMRLHRSCTTHLHRLCTTHLHRLCTTHLHRLRTIATAITSTGTTSGTTVTSTTTIDTDARCEDDARASCGGNADARSVVWKRTARGVDTAVDRLEAVAKARRERAMTSF